MKLPSLRIRSYLLLVAILALLLWGGMTGLRWYNYSRLAGLYSVQERYYRERAQLDIAQGKTRTIEARWGLRIADHYGSLARKYRRAMWRPWIAVQYEPRFFDPEKLPTSQRP